MKDDTEVKFAWKIWHLISLLNDLIWDYYKNEFIKQNRQYTGVLYRGSLNDYMSHDDPQF